MSKVKFPIWSFCFFIALWADKVDAEKIAIRERVDAGMTIRSVNSMTASGLYFLNPPAESKDVKFNELKPETLKIQVQTQLRVLDRWRLHSNRNGVNSGELRAKRIVESAQSDVGGEVRGSRTLIRDDRRRFLVDLNDNMVRTASVDGPLTRPELEALTVPADSVALWTLLPKEEIQSGDIYSIDNLGARTVSLFDSIAVNNLKGKVDEISADNIRISLTGDIRGAVLGAEGVMKVGGKLVYDRRTGLVSSLELERDESRRPGSVEAGLEINSRVKVERQLVENPPEALKDEFDSTWPTSIEPSHLLLMWVEPNQLFTIEHDRDWHLTWSDTQESVLKRVDRGGTVVSQCNLKLGPKVMAGTHQDPAQFRDDVKEALGKQFTRFFGEGVLDRTSGQGYGYKLAVEGKVQDLPVAWYYYLLSAPDGNQYLGTVTTTLSETQSSSKAGLLLVESLRWLKKPDETAKPMK